MSDIGTSRTRTRTITWEDPLSVLERGKTMSGLEYLQALQAGEHARNVTDGCDARPVNFGR